MILHSPFSIGPRLLPALQIGAATISLEAEGVRNNRLCWRWYIDLPDGREFSAADLQSGCQDTDNARGTQKAFCALLSFLSACADGYKYQQRTGREVDSADLFPPEVAQWAMECVDEIDSINIDLEETPDLLADNQD